ncbi:phytolongin Phyl2.2-like [Punica granatum]|uniref:Phytolongin Phyl2.2-like n=1 Tax=Punica granatum TaxID=22663 RepID=A0A6P8CJL7_PUNGR|nr:phytolongin Phyl2.2-like [Punica granatum]
MARISNPDLVFYACIARGATILAEYNRDQPDLPQLALKCIQLTPRHHSMFSQTCRRRSYTFLIDDPLVYFGIFDDALSKSERLHLLSELKGGFLELIKNGSVKSSSNLSPGPSLQAKFDAVLRELIPSGSDLESVSSPRSDGKKPPGLEPPKGGRNFTAQVMGSPGKRLKKKKRFNGEAINGGGSDGIIGKEINLENKVDVCDEMNGLVPKNNSYSVSDRQKAKQVWKKQVWVVLLLDLFVCAILFGVWLWVCRGFRCIDG